MSNRTARAAASKDIVFVPLCKLKKSPKNVRKIPHANAEIAALAASIRALGMLQWPVGSPFAPSSGSTTGYCSMPSALMLAARALMSASVWGIFRTFLGDFFSLASAMKTSLLAVLWAVLLLMVSLLWFRVLRKVRA